jgi:putative transposase
MMMTMISFICFFKNKSSKYFKSTTLSLFFITPLLMPDYAHILLGFNPKYAISDTVHLIKTYSTDFIKDKGFTPFKFNWQDGYGAFSHSRTELNKVFTYILNQEEHHRKRSFKSE